MEIVNTVRERLYLLTYWPLYLTETREREVIMGQLYGLSQNTSMRGIDQTLDINPNSMKSRPI